MLSSLGSSRGQRLGERVIRWVLTRAKEVPEADFVLFGLACYQLPFFDEAIAPWDNPDRHPAPNVARWLEDMASADGYLFVVPEYNLAVPAVVKNALDLLAYEADAKPASILTYSDTFNGGVTAGHLPYLLRELVHYAAALRPLRQEMAAWEKPWRG